MAYDSSAPSPAIFSSNGNKVGVYYKFAIKDSSGKSYDNGPDVPLIVGASFVKRGGENDARGDLSCPNGGSVTGRAKYGANVYLEYIVTGYDEVQKNTPDTSGNSYLSAKTRFALKFGEGGGVVCTGWFNYFRDTYPTNVVPKNFVLSVYHPKLSSLQAQKIIDLEFAAPLVAAPQIFYSAQNSAPLNTSLFTSAIQAPGTRFIYMLMYRNGYSLPVPGVKITCTIGNAPPFTVVTNSYSQIPLTGSLTMTMQPRTTKPPIPPAVWDVTTSLTGNSTAFTLTRGQKIGAVKCSSPDATPATFSQDLGTW